MRSPGISGILEAASLIAAYHPSTPLVSPPLLRERLGCTMWVKNETVSPVASFKWRGALTAVLRDGGAGAVVTSSTGNHGQGVAWAAAETGRAAHVFLPRNPNPAKRAKIAHLGGTVHESGDDLDEAKAAAIAFARDRAMVFVDDGESADVIEGAGTCGLEIAAALEGVDLVLVPMGSGSLASGVAIAVKSRYPSARIVAVQSAGAPAMRDSFHAGTPVERPVLTIADGLVCRVPAALALQALLRHVDDAIVVGDDEILEAMALMAEYAHLLVEPAGAAALAGALKLGVPGKRVVVVASGANATGEQIRRAFAN